MTDATSDSMTYILSNDEAKNKTTLFRLIYSIEEFTLEKIDYLRKYRGDFLSA